MITQESITNYIRQNRDTYTRKAITQQLLEQGFSRVAIEGAWMNIEAPKINYAAIKTYDRPPSVSIFAIVFLWTICSSIICFIFWFTTVLLSEDRNSIGNFISNQIVGINLLFVLIEIGALVAALHMRRRGSSRFRVLAIPVVINFLWFAVLTGICSYPI